MKIPIADVAGRFQPHRAALHAALDRALDHGQVILGPEVGELEAALADAVGCRHAIGVANGTDALILSLRAMNAAGGDVITTPLSYLASTSSIVLAGATPIFADIGDDLNLDPDAVERAITDRTRAILVVHVGGNPARMAELTALAQARGLKLIEDCAQAFGATTNGRAVGHLSDVGATSFHPLKNLGTLGDGGAIFTNDDAAATWLRQARNHGHSSRDQCEFWSINSRLDSLQAGFLLSLLPAYAEFLQYRRTQAARYRRGLEGLVQFPRINPGSAPTYNFMYIVAERRDELKATLEQNGIDARIHYPVPIHRLNAAAALRPAALPRTEWYTRRILSLPLGRHVSDADIDYVIQIIAGFYR